MVFLPSIELCMQCIQILLCVCARHCRWGIPSNTGVVSVFQEFTFNLGEGDIHMQDN